MRANDAIKESNEAMTEGDWAAYGTAQENLNKALEDAIKAEEEISGETIVEEDLDDELDEELDADVDGGEVEPDEG